MVFVKRTRSLRSKPSSLSSGGSNHAATQHSNDGIRSCLKGRNRSYSGSTHSSTQKSIRFGQVRIREFERIIGDNPSCSSGAPIGIGWKHGTEKYCTVQEYELAKLQHSRSHHSRSAFVLTRHEREQLLLEWGANLQEIVESIRTNVRIKHQRRRTVNNRYDRWEEVMERASRKIKKTILVGRSTSGGGAGIVPTTGTMQPMSNHSSSSHSRSSVPPPPAYISHHHDHPQQDQLRKPTTIDSHFQSESPSLPPTRPLQRTHSAEGPPPGPHPAAATSTTHEHNASPPARRVDPPVSPKEAESVAAATVMSRGSSMPYQYMGYDSDDVDNDGVFAMEEYTESGTTSIGTDFDDDDDLTNTDCSSVIGRSGGNYQYAPAAPSPSPAFIDDNPRPVERMESDSSNTMFVSLLNDGDDNSENDHDDVESIMDGHHLSALTMEDITDITPSGANDDEQDDIFLTSTVSGLTSGCYPPQAEGSGSTSSSNSFPDGNFETLHRDTSFWEVQRNNADGPCIMRRSVPVTISEDSMINCFPTTAKTANMAVPRLVSRWD